MTTTQQVRIRKETYKEIQRLMINEIQETGNLNLTYISFMDKLVSFYQENKK